MTNPMKSTNIILRLKTMEGAIINMSNDTVVKKLLNDFNAKIKEARKIYTTLQTLKDYGADFELPDFGEIKTNEERSAQSFKSIQIRPDEFFGQTNNEAAEKYLRKVGHAIPLNNIYDALLQGGIKFTGDGHRNLYTQLIRANRKFVKIGIGQDASFGIIDWYPKRTRSEEIIKKIGKAIGNSAEKKGIENRDNEDTFTVEIDPKIRRRKRIPAEQAENSSKEEENKT